MSSRTNINQQGSQNNEVESMQTSPMTTLILWNVNKALEKNPALELKSALKNAQNSLESEQANVSAIVNQRPDERHLSCAMLAWQQLGHSHADSLYSFVVAQMNRQNAEKAEQAKVQSSKPRSFGPFPRVTSSKPPNCDRSFISYDSATLDSLAGSCYAGASAMGPVLKLPVTPKVPLPVVPVYAMHCGGLRKTGQDIKNRIEKACCLESACLEKLIKVDKETKELRVRLGKLAKREAQRIELLERAETAWRDLEMGYMRRLRTCVEKEEDISRQSAKIIADRNANKEACAKLVQILKPRGETAEQARGTLQKLESDVCARACERLQMSETAAKEDAILVQLQCQSNKQDRDLLFKEEQARRKKASVENDLESIRGLTYETERAIKAELTGFKDQMNAVSKELFEEDELIEKLKKERDELLEEKKELIEDLEGCQEQCDDSMEVKCDELKEKREKLNKLKEQEIECRCKFPIETSVQVQRTASLAALCYCAPEDRLKKTCSCTSIRTRLMSDLFSTMFEGLQFEMADCSVKMPCQLLKCLEDKHNWDKASVTKTNLRSFFAKMLCGELDIAIINSIEKYHARWVSTSCADMGRPIPDFDDPDIESWQDRALAQKAHWMAEAMAEKMFQEKVDDIMEQAQQVVSSAPPPCKCKPPEVPNMDHDAAVYRCLLEPITPSNMLPIIKSPHLTLSERKPSLLKIMPEYNTMKPNALVSVTTNTPKKKLNVAKSAPKTQKEPVENTRAQWLQKNDVMVLKAEIEDLKKDSLRKHDLKMIEQTIKKLVQRVSGIDLPAKLRRNSPKNERVTADSATCSGVKSMSMKRKRVESRFKRDFAVNMCLCEVPKNSSSKSEKHELNELADDSNAGYNLNEYSFTKSGNQIPNDVAGSSNATFDLNKNSLTKSGRQKLDDDADYSNILKLNQSEKNVSEDIISQNINIKQSKPVTRLPSEQIKQPEKNVTCGKDCNCFNKIPSCTSIDKLLDTLIKWKSDLSEQPGMSEKIESQTNFKKIADDVSSKIKDMSAVVCQSIVIKGVPKDNISELNKSGKMSRITNGGTFEGNYGVQATVSEYIGAVNLEKSNENVCKCILNKEKCKESCHSKISKESKKSKRDMSLSFCKSKLKVSDPKKVESYNRKKAKSEEYNQKNAKYCNQRQIKSQEFYNHTKANDNKENISLSNKSCLNKVMPTFKSVSQENKQAEKSKPVPLLLVNENYKEMKENDSTNGNFTLQEQSDRNFIDPGMLSCGCDYEIKLLGVTLDNANTSKNKFNRFKELNNEVLTGHKLKTHDQSQELKSHVGNADSSSNCYPLKSMEHYDLFQNYKTDMSDLEPICQCGGKFDELKDLLENIYREKGDIKEDKSPNTNNLQGQSKFDTSFLKDASADEQCVCCINFADESNELEVNTFQLLQEHLKKKLANLKDTCQSSYCIKPDEEDTILAEIFKKIKQTITDSTGKLACKCSEEMTNKGSWQRAYNLLQEYLKIKISRVQCSCSLPDQGKNQTILPELTDKVCILIEKDFERLKNICKCRSNKKSASNKSSFNEEFQVPEKDADRHKKCGKTESNSLKKSSIIKELSSKSYVITTSNMSAQVIPNFETKSCEAIKNDLIKSTVETQSSNNACSHPNKTRSIDCKLLGAVNIVSNQSTQYSRGNDEELEPNPFKSENIFTKFKELEVELKQYKPVEDPNSTSLPYIGYTIDCSNNLGSSVCPRASICNNTKAINEFWSTYSKTQTNIKNLSYVMDSVYKNKVDLPENVPYNSSKKSMLKTVTQRNTKTNTQKVGAITLKDSREYLNKQSCHGGTNTEDDALLYSSGTDDTSEDCWFEPKYEVDECEDILEPPKKKSVHFLHRSKSEVVATESLKSESFNPDCDCSKVPVCHVKMLVKNIESKLANAECTCDSLSAKVCPVHSKIDAQF